MSDLDTALEQFDKMLEPEDPEKETPQEAQTPEEAPVQETAEPEEPQRDPAVQAYLDKYGGDPDKAIAAAVEAQRLIGKQGEELGELRKLIEDRLPEERDEDYGVPMDASTASWFDTLMEENPIQAMEWARNNDPSGAYYNRGMGIWFDSNPAQAATYQNAVIAQALRDEFKESLATQTKPLQDQAHQQTLNSAWTEARKEFPDLDEHAEAMLEEAKASPEILRGADSPDQMKRAINMLYRLAKGAAATTLETAKQEAETEQKQANRDAKLSGTAPATRARSPEPESEDPQWLQEFDAVLERKSSD